jgi:hypothetical protein
MFSKVITVKTLGMKTITFKLKLLQLQYERFDRAMRRNRIKNGI